MIKRGENMKKIVLIAAVLATAFTTNANAGNGRDLVEYLYGDQLLHAPANSVHNKGNSGKLLMFPNIDINNVIGAVIGTVIDPRGYPAEAYPNGKRPKFNVQYGRGGTGRCQPDPNANGIFCN
jgi:hypothetical protein